MGKESRKEWFSVYIYITEALCYTPEPPQHCKSTTIKIKFVLKSKGTE